MSQQQLTWPISPSGTPHKIFNLFTSPLVTYGWNATVAHCEVKLLKMNITLSEQSNKTQDSFSPFPAYLPYFLTESLWFIWATVAALSMQWAKGTLGNFMIHDEASGIIVNVCMCHCILIMVSVSWKHQHTFKENNLIFSLLSLFYALHRQILFLQNPKQPSIGVHLGLRKIKSKTANDRGSKANQ